MNIIETHDLCKQYGNALRVAHLDLNVPEGSVYGFLGPNGAGKSTTLKMILGLVRPTAGSIRVLGKNMDSSNRLSVLRQAGSLIESPSYYGHLTGEENLRIVQTLRDVPEENIREVFRLEDGWTPPPSYQSDLASCKSVPVSPGCPQGPGHW